MDTLAAAPQVALDSLTFVGSDLARPECVLCTAAGDVFVADWRGGVTRIAPDGAQRLCAAKHPDGGPLQPNGIALAADGSFLLAHLGAETGGVFRLTGDGSALPFVLEADGVALPPSNFVLEDGEGRVWITVSTRRTPRALGYRRDAGDGFIVLADRAGARIVADRLGFANEVALDPTGEWLYVNETFARRLSRFRIGRGGALGPKEVVTTFGEGTYPDGLAFDAEGHAWIVSIISNRVLRVAPDGTPTVIVEDADPAHIAWTEAAWRTGELGRPHLDRAVSRVLKNTSSIAFGGADLRTAYLGCLLDTRLPVFRAPVAGHPPPHWHRRTAMFDR